MNHLLFKIFPLIVKADQNVKTITIQASGHSCTGKRILDKTHQVRKIVMGGPVDPAAPEWRQPEALLPFDRLENGDLEVRLTCPAEDEYMLALEDENGTEVQRFSIYALKEDLFNLRPYKGDFHIHSCNSDGKETASYVAASCRKIGFDFMALTDHCRYEPSLEAMEAMKKMDTDMLCCPGEEVHLPGTTVHVVNAGGLFSVNGLLPMKENYLDTNGELSKRRFDESVTPPDVLKMDDFWQQIADIESTLTVPEGVDAKSYAVCLWIFDKIREAQGLGIFAHPYWIQDLWQIPEKFTRFMLKNHPFDAFEVLGGENYYQQNGYQAALYYDEYRYGRVHPIVGSTDSHSSMPTNRNWDICSTILFATENTREAILQAVKEKYSVAVDTISKEYRLVGEFRLQKYACFLMENYFPIHDKQAAIDGELTYQYAIGNATKEELELIASRAETLMKKYILLKA